MAKEYVKKWKVPSSSNPDKSYTVSLTKEGNYECSCPTWIYRRQECHHIKAIKANPEGGEVKPLVVVPANVCEVTKDGDNVLAPLIPLNRAETTHFLATIIYDCNRLGVPFGTLREHFHIMPHEWTLESVKGYIRTYGRMIQVKGDGISPWDFQTRITFDGIEASLRVEMTKHQEELKELFCEDCLKDDNIKCKRDKDVKCLHCGVELCGHHIVSHLKEKHQISISWRGF